jgi:hypothetical protein
MQNNIADVLNILCVAAFTNSPKGFIFSSKKRPASNLMNAGRGRQTIIDAY